MRAPRTPAAAGQRGRRRGRHRRRRALLRRLSHHAVHRDRRGARAAPAARSAARSSRWKTRSPPSPPSSALRWPAQKALTATSGPGFSLMQELIGFAAMAQIPCVIVDVMRGGPSTGLPTEPSQGDVMQARWGTHGEHSMIALVPSSVLECYTLTVEAFNLSERFRTPVIILSDALVGHMREAVTLPAAARAARRRARRAGLRARRLRHGASRRSTTSCRGRRSARASACTSPVWSTTAAAAPPRPATPRSPATWADTCARRSTTTATPSCEVEEFMMEDAEVAIFAYGSVARSARAVVRWARAQGRAAWASCGRSPCGRSRPRPSTHMADQVQAR